MNNVHAFFGVISKLRYILTSQQKKQSILVFFCMIISSVLELLGVSVILPFLEIMMDEHAARSKWYISWIYALSPDISFKRVILIFCGIIIAVYLIKNIMALLCTYVQFRFATSFQRELSTRMLSSIMKRPYEFFVNVNSTRVFNFVLADTTATYSVLVNLFEFFSNVLTVAMIGAFLLYTDWFVAILAIALAGIVFLLIVIVFKPRLKVAGKSNVIAENERGMNLGQAIYGIKEISVMDRRQLFVERYEKSARKVSKLNLEYNFLSACPDRILEGLCIGGFIGIAGIRVVTGNNPAEFIPTLGAFAMGAFKILPSISKMSTRINAMVYNKVRLDSCYDNLREAERFDAEQRLVVIDADDKANISFENKLEIKNINWKYQNSTEDVLHGLSVTIHKGEAVGLIGSSGAGKTTLADIILGLLIPQQGQILMDGIDIATIPHTWARTIAYVPQTVYLTDDTIRENVAFGIRADEIDDDIIWETLEQAQLASFIRTLPEGLDTFVGERGVKLSGGQRQRIAIARALYNSPDILVLDEATSALDNETEAAVMESIDALLGQKTLIIIAHRLTTIEKCDTVYEIKDGKAVLAENRR